MLYSYRMSISELVGVRTRHVIVPQEDFMRVTTDPFYGKCIDSGVLEDSGEIRNNKAVRHLIASEPVLRKLLHAEHQPTGDMEASVRVPYETVAALPSDRRERFSEMTHNGELYHSSGNAGEVPISFLAGSEQHLREIFPEVEIIDAV